jgi:hypothetical protein
VRIIIGAFGFILLFVGLIGIPIALLAIFDPVGTQMADDNNPYGYSDESVWFHLTSPLLLEHWCSRRIFGAEISSQDARIRLTN